MEFNLNDGGRADAGFKGKTRDCVCRSVAIISGLPYEKVYQDIIEYAKRERPRKGKKRSHPRTGVHTPTLKRYLKDLGFEWVPTMKTGSGCKVHLAEGELPDGRLIVNVSRHITAVIDQVIHDNHDPRRETIVIENGVQRIARRCVYGYWHKPGT